VATEPQLTLDTLQRVRYQGDECLIDIEVEARPKTDIGHRLYMYATRAHIVHQLPVYSVVLWLEPHGKPVSSPYVMRAGDRVCCQWYFTGVELYRLQACDLLAQGTVGLLPLIPFMAGGASEGVIEQTAQQLKQRVDQPELGELVTLLAVFAARHFDDAFVLDLVRRAHMSTEIIEQSSLYQRWIREGREEGLREGLLAVLTGRFGALPAELPRLNRQSPQRL